ncbi:MAG: multidrug effflux MFS transporter [Saprospiraceae bacterium]|nr:multidrug effflux MFS transporter [Saprospiraceae bacterium]
MKKISETQIIWVLGLLNGLMPFSTDLYLPAFNNISTDLNISFGAVALTMSTFFAGSCIGQLVNGPLLDRFGRKKPILTGLALFSITSLGCAMANSLPMLLALRFTQALGISLCAVGSRTVVRDVFPAEKTALIFSTLALIMGIAPIIAPLVGSLVLEIGNWRSIFHLLAVLSFVLIVVVYIRLPESMTDTTKYSLHPKSILNSYKEVIRTPSFFSYALVAGLSSGSLFAWISSSSLIFMENFGLNTRQFGWVFASTASCLLISNQINRILLKKYPPKTIAFFAAKSQVAITALLIFIVIFAFKLPYVLGGLYLFMLSLHLITPNAMALSVNNFTKNIGSANAILGTFTMTLSALVTSFLGLVYDGTALPMVITMFILALISSLIQYRTFQKT